MLNSIYDNIQDAVQQKNFYNAWVNKLEVAYEYMSNNIDELYNAKKDFNSETSFIYTSKLIDYYSKLKELYMIYVKNKHLLTEEQRKNNYNVIQNEVHILLNKYKDFIMTLSAIKDLNEYKNINISANLSIFDEEI